MTKMVRVAVGSMLTAVLFLGACGGGADSSEETTAAGTEAPETTESTGEEAASREMTTVSFAPTAPLPAYWPYYYIADPLGFYEDEGIDVAVYQSVRAVAPSSPLDFDQRVQAVQAFRRLPEAEALAAANKRVANILSKADIAIEATVDPALLHEPAEVDLAKAVQDAERAAEPLARDRQYTGSLESLAALREPVDAFFDQVLVNAEEPAIKANRYALLARLRGLFLGVADISLLG